MDYRGDPLDRITKPPLALTVFVSVILIGGLALTVGAAISTHHSRFTQRTNAMATCPTCGQEAKDPAPPDRGQDQHFPDAVPNIGSHPDHSPEALQQRLSLGMTPSDWSPQSYDF